jgi:hypothetical protein
VNSISCVHCGYVQHKMLISCFSLLQSADKRKCISTSTFRICFFLKYCSINLQEQIAHQTPIFTSCRGTDTYCCHSTYPFHVNHVLQSKFWVKKSIIQRFLKPSTVSNIHFTVWWQKIVHNCCFIGHNVNNSVAM